jgi:hypothetical protein
MRPRSIAYGRTAHPVTVGMDYRFRRRRCICSKCYRFVTHLNDLERCADNDVAAKSYVLCRVIRCLKQQNRRSHCFSWPRRHLIVSEHRRTCTCFHMRWARVTGHAIDEGHSCAVLPLDEKAKAPKVGSLRGREAFRATAVLASNLPSYRAFGSSRATRIVPACHINVNRRSR